MHSYLVPVRKAFEKAGDPLNAAGAKAYMRNQFDFFGLKTEQRRAISKTFYSQNLPDISELPAIIADAWVQPQREMQYFAIELAACYKKQWPKEIIAGFEKMIVNKSWWDTVDAIASRLSGPYFQAYPNQVRAITGKWNRSENIWLQRSSLLFQILYKNKTDTILLEKYIQHLSGSEEFFIQKAIGWVLRQYARTDPYWVTDFVKDNKLKPLSRREAMKHL